ncbi:MAG TPA: rhodanese-like domain-containing protein [Cyanobacteria bacterium UBA8530]|nr:rhodanese-like domain-containing protein [Cyanobacteria bacterium UBA8530]
MKKLASLVFLVFLASCANPAFLSVLSAPPISADQAYSILRSDPEVLVIDVRSQAEFRRGHLEGAILVPHNEIPALAEELLPFKDRKVLLYCRSGMRSRMAAKHLEDLGFSNVKELAGGLASWRYGTVKD